MLDKLINYSKIAITRKYRSFQRVNFAIEVSSINSIIQKGIPLKIDPFFQFIKNNLKAREIYLKFNDRFTVENVIDIALRQDIGSDPSLSRIRSSDKTDTKGRADLLN